MKRNTLIAIFMVAIMAFSVGGAAFAGSAAAQSDTGAQTYDSPVHINVDTDKENVSVALTENVTLSAGETVTYQTAAYPDSAEVVNSSGSGSFTVSINANGEVEVTETTGSNSVTIEELQVTFNTAQLPYVSTDAEPVDENYTGDATITFNDQQSDGERLTLSAANESEFFVAIHKVENGSPVTKDDDGELTYVGASDVLSGDYETVNVDLADSFENDTNLTAKLYTSDNGKIGSPIDGTNNTAQITVDEVVMSDYTSLVDGPGTETVQWMAYHADKIVNTTIEADNGAFNGSTYEPNETGEDVQFTVEMTRNGTPYEGLDLSDLDLSFALDTNVFSDIEDNTELDSETLTLKEITEKNGQKEYVYDVVQPNNDTTTYTLELNGTVTAANSEDAVTVGSIQTPNDGPTAEHQSVYEITEGGDAAFFANIGNVGPITAVLGFGAVGILGGALIVSRDPKRFGLRGFSINEGGLTNPKVLVWLVGIGVGLVLVIDGFTGGSVVGEYVGVSDTIVTFAGFAVTVVSAAASTRPYLLR